MPTVGQENSQLKTENSTISTPSREWPPKAEREREREQNQSMPDNEELDSPTTVVGGDEYFPNFSEREIQILTEQLKQAEKFIKALQEHYEQEFSDYQKHTNCDNERLRHCLRKQEKLLKDKDLNLFQFRSQIRVLKLNYDQAWQQLNEFQDQLEETSYLYEFEQARNQIIYDTLKSVVLERDILAKKYALAKGKIWRRERRLSELTAELTAEEELVDLKDNRIDNLTDHIQQLQTQITRLTKQNDQKNQAVNQSSIKNKTLTKLISKIEKKVKKLERVKTNKKHNCQRINSLNQKLKKLTNEKKHLQTKNDFLKDELTYYQDQDHKLAEKDRIIQEQAQRIRELENKPPVVETRTQTVEKIKEVEKEKLVEKPVEKLVDNPNDKQEIVRLKEFIKRLEKKLAEQQLTPAKTNLVKVPIQTSQEIWILRILLLSCALLGLFLLVKKIKKLGKKTK